MLGGGVYAVLSGFLGAAASCCGKLSLSERGVSAVCERALSSTLYTNIYTTETHSTAVCEWLHIPLRVVCGLLLFVCNAVMWTFFAKALRLSSSSAQATVTSTASNFISSAFLGYLIFGESHDMLWWTGITLTLLGLFILHGLSSQDRLLNAKKEE
ncbi:transmembrane protein 42a [Hoplias malabaricus]|uniref:transmembrane protein 42a n=1 Tax=Hoplias malabaricus TaxID=27720 RepID=UPI003462D5C5